MAMNRYVGMRYVPIIVGEHSTERSYEALSIVTDANGASYTSKRDVPIGIALSNTDYWVCTGNYNAQVDSYRAEVTEAVEHIDATAESMSTEFDAKLDDMDDRYTADKNALQSAWDDEVTSLNNTWQGDVNDLNDLRNQTVTDFNTAISRIPIKYYNGLSQITEHDVVERVYKFETVNATYTVVPIIPSGYTGTLTMRLTLTGIQRYYQCNLKSVIQMLSGSLGTDPNKIPDGIPNNVVWEDTSGGAYLTLTWNHVDFGSSSSTLQFNNLILDLYEIML